MNNGADPIILELDDRPVQEGVKRSNRAIDDFGARTKRTNQEVGNSFEIVARKIEQQSRAVQSLGNSFENTLKAVAAATRGAVELSAAMLLGAKAIAAQATAAGTLEAAWNRVRVARVGAAAVTEGLGGALVVGTEIAAVVAIEKIAKATYDRSREIQSQALAAQRTGFTYEDRSALDFTAQRYAKPPDYFDSAVKSAGGVAQLAKELRELADVNDPLVRAELAFKEFGPDAEKVLDSLGGRFGDSIQRAQEWGIALDNVSRTRVDSFRRDIDGIRGSFDSFRDSIAATKQQLTSLLELDFASVWQIGKAVATDESGRSAYKQLFTEPDPKDVLKGAQRDIQQRSSANATALAQQEMLRSLTGPAQNAFQKDFFARDHEADLQAEIADLRKKLFVSDRTSADFGRLVSGASFPGGYGAQAESLQKLTSDQGELARVIEHKKEVKDADEAARKAAQELASAQRTVAAELQSAQLAELSGMDRLRKERDNQIQQYGKTRDLVRDINAAFDIRFGIESKAIRDQSDKDLQTRAAAEARSQEQQLAARTGYTSRAILDTIRISGEEPAKRDDVARQGADLDRESQLRQIESMDAKTLAQKQIVEQRKFEIEANYFTRVQDFEAAGIDRGYQKQLQDLKVLVDAKLITQAAYNQQAAALEQNEALDLVRLHANTDAEIEKSGFAAAKAVREEYQRQFDTIKGEASGLLNTLFTNPSAFGKQLAETVRTAALRPIIDSMSDNIAGALHPIIYGGSQGRGVAAALKGAAGGRSQDPLRISSEQLKGSTDINSVATDRNTDALLRMAQSWDRASGGSGAVQAVASSTENHIRRIAESTERVEASGGSTPAIGALPSIARTVALSMASSSFGPTPRVTSQLIPRQSQEVTYALRSTGPGSAVFERGGFGGAGNQTDLGIPPPIGGDFRGTDFAYGDRFSLPTSSSASSSQFGVPAGVSGLNSLFGDNPAAMLGPGGTAPFAGDWGGFSSSGSTSAGGGGFLSAIPKLFGGSTDSSQGAPTGMRAILGLGTSSPYGQQSQVPGSQAITGGVKETLADLKHVDWGHFNHSPITGTPGPDENTPGTDNGGGGISGVGGLAGAGMQMGGMALAQRGLLGQDRGTGKGIAEGTAGGAIVGFQQGGPLGAAIGAAVGFSIGLGEMLAGVESPENKAIRLVKDLYHVDINIQMARQIVQIANSKYGTNVNYAIRSPEVRQMLELYSAGTGQAGKMPLSSTTPMGASLVETGGSLYQAQQYRFGNAYVSQSNLGVLGGGSPSVLPNPGASTYVSLNISGQSAADLLEGRIANTVTPGYIQNGFASAQAASAGRVQNAAMLQSPGLITS